VTAAVLAGFITALIAPWLVRIGGRAAGWLLSLLPLGLAIYFASHVDLISSGRTLVSQYAWVPSLDVQFSFYLDGLSLLFALLITGIGAVVVIYAGGYLEGHPQLGRFYALLLIFMASMLGLVLADNVITLFVFWELTSLSSYFLIGFDHQRERARSAALQALLLTGGGGLALLVGFLLLGQAGGSFELSTLLRQGDIIRAHVLYLPVLLLILIGAFTKSAQMPFHFWLPSAMEAPTPVSAYLHAATMVKAGVYLLARLNPVMGGTEVWQYTVGGVGAVTMLVSAYLALVESDLKRILAYSTISALGMLMLLLALGTPFAIQAAVVFLLAHALYKGALFLVAGAVDHETGQRDVDRLGGLWRWMPVTAAAAGLAAVSMAGLPPTFGFISKELLYEAALEWTHIPALLAGTVILTGMLLVAIAGTVSVKPFVGPKPHALNTPQQASVNLWIGPALLALLGMIVGLWPDLVASSLMSPSAIAIFGQPLTLKLSLWHGLNPVLGLSALTLIGGVGLYLGRDVLCRLRESDSLFALGARWNPTRAYERAIRGLQWLARAQTQVLQSGYLRFYLLIILVTAVTLVGYTLIRRIQPMAFQFEGTQVRFYEMALAALILMAAGAVVRSTSRLGAVALLGAVGYGIALLYVLFGAPDLAMTQILIETLTVIIFVLVFYNLPRFARFSSRRARVRDALVALSVGGLMTTLVLVAIHVQLEPAISGYFAENSWPVAHARNIVNAIIVDFRALDTLGEITVLALAAVGVYALLKLRLETRDRRDIP
jgi:multicomponent Na+:H+ antiporter subunit A